MYTKQIIGSVGVGAIVGFLFLRAGYPSIAVVGALAVGYFISRWIWATVQRTRYWLSRGSRQYNSRECPNCNRKRHRMSGDWILTCHKCGWKPGFPILRWAFHSLPVIQFRQSVSNLSAFVVGVSLTLLLTSQPDIVSSPTIHVPNLSVNLPNLPSFEQVVFAATMVVIMIGLALWMLRPQQYYCKACGQDLGRGDPPDCCPKCGSNRFTNEDPGVGEKIRID